MGEGVGFFDVGRVLSKALNGKKDKIVEEVKNGVQNGKKELEILAGKHEDKVSLQSIESKHPEDVPKPNLAELDVKKEPIPVIEDVFEGKIDSNGKPKLNVLDSHQFTDRNVNVKLTLQNVLKCFPLFENATIAYVKELAFLTLCKPYSSEAYRTVAKALKKNNNFCRMHNMKICHAGVVTMLDAGWKGRGTAKYMWNAKYLVYEGSESQYPELSVRENISPLLQGVRQGGYLKSSELLSRIANKLSNLENRINVMYTTQGKGLNLSESEQRELFELMGRKITLLDEIDILGGEDGISTRELLEQAEEAYLEDNIKSAIDDYRSLARRNEKLEHKYVGLNQINDEMLKLLFDFLQIQDGGKQDDAVEDVDEAEGAVDEIKG